MQITARFLAGVSWFAKAPWTVKVAMMIAPVAIFWSVNLEIHKLHFDLPDRDFTNYWVGSRLLFAGRIADVFEPRRYIHAMALYGVKRWPPLSFSYPPTMLPLVAWTGLFRYHVALVIWSLLGLSALFAAAWPHSKDPWIAGAALVSPALLQCLDAGQNGLFTSALLVGALTRIDRRPILAGVLIGLLTAKPQLGILLPVALLAAGRWRVIAAATVSALGLFSMSLLVVGLQAWRMYITESCHFRAPYTITFTAVG